MELLSKGGAKMVLKIKLVGTSSVKMQLVSINKNYVKTPNSNNFNFFQDEENDFVIWSTQDFVFNDRQIRIPDENNIKDLMIHTHDYDHDMHRYDSLKKLYDTLQKWSDEMDLREIFLNTSDKKKVIMVGDYWFVT